MQRTTTRQLLQDAHQPLGNASQDPTGAYEITSCVAVHRRVIVFRQNIHYVQIIKSPPTFKESKPHSLRTLQNDDTGYYGRCLSLQQVSTSSLVETTVDQSVTSRQCCRVPTVTTDKQAPVDSTIKKNERKKNFTRMETLRCRHETWF